MPKKSIAFENMRKALYEALLDIPPGRVVEFSEMGTALNFPARHVAFIVSKMTRDELEILPCYRLVPKGGKLGPPQKWTPKRTRQAALLRKEGICIEETGTIRQLHERLHVPNDRHSNVFWADGVHD